MAEGLSVERLNDGWERFDYSWGETVWQRTCPDCSSGLLYEPVRFCPRCHGDGFITTRTDPVGVPVGDEDTE